MQLIVEVMPTEITISMPDGVEVVHWVNDEWEEDPTIVPAIANAIHLAYYDPEELVALNYHHIESQRRMK